MPTEPRLCALTELASIVMVIAGFGEFTVKAAFGFSHSSIFNAWKKK